jgi:precorrin-2 dehydrogenase / sirohydrochlorin ferrochelatase
MSSPFGLPLLLDGDWISALVVGGGPVALRKANGLLDGGASVRVLARELHPHLAELAARSPRLTLERGDYSASAIADATLVVAATNDAHVNSTIAADARARGRLVMVADAPAEGNCVTPAIHRVGSLVIAIGTGGVPGAASRIRDEIAEQFDDRYAAAIADLTQLRGRLLTASGRARWRVAADALIGEDFCDSVEEGNFAERIASWR